MTLSIIEEYCYITHYVYIRPYLDVCTSFEVPLELAVLYMIREGKGREGKGREGGGA